MSRRIIPCQVTDEYVRGSGMVVGAAGSHNDVALRLEFGPMWAGTARSIVWKDALGGNPTITTLGTDLLETGETEVYIVPIPAEPKAYAGDMTMTIKGAVVDGDKETSATLTARAFFTVMESDWDEDAEETKDITPTQAEQFQAQLEAIKDDIANSAQAAADAAASAEAAAQSETAAGQHAESAGNSASLAALSAQGAAGSATNANDSRLAAALSAVNAGEAQTAAENAARQAEASNQAAAQSQSAAAASEKNAAESEQNVAQNAENAAQSAQAAGQSATSAASSAADAEACKAAAAASQQAAKQSETQAEYWATQAEAAAGGDFATKIEAQGYANTAKEEANKYTDQKIAAIPTPDVSGQIGAHNTDTSAHDDMRLLIAGLTTRLNALANSDDTTLDQMAEVVAYIKDNRELIEQHGGEQSDWNENDPESKAHVKNRFGGYYETDWEPLIENITIDGFKYDSDFGGYYSYNADALSAVSRTTGTIKYVIDGVEYVGDCVFYTTPTYEFVCSDPYLYVVNEVLEGSIHIHLAQEGESHVISAYKQVESPVPIDEKFLPDTVAKIADVINQIGTHNTDTTAHSEIREALAGGAKIATWSYTGTGTSGVDNPNSLTFDFAPKVLMMLDISNGIVIPGDGRIYTEFAETLTTTYQSSRGFCSGSSGTNYAKKSSDGKTIYWYCASSSAGATYQCNVSGKVYSGIVLV